MYIVGLSLIVFHGFFFVCFVLINQHVNPTISVYSFLNLSLCHVRPVYAGLGATYYL